MTNQDSIFYKRQSKRSFLEEPVEKDKLERILEIVRWSPSCNNNQPWRFLVVTDPEQRAKFVECLPRGNQYAQKAPVLFAVCGREEDDHNREDDPVKYYQFDSGLATMSLLLAAVDEGLMAHAMAGYDAARLHSAFDIPDEYHIMCVVAMGYQGPLEALTDRWREYDESPRKRKEMSEIVTFEKFEL